MTEQIAKVTLNYTYYDGLDNYSDGPIEDDMLAIAKSGTIEAALQEGAAFISAFADKYERIRDMYPNMTIAGLHCLLMAYAFP